MIKNFIPNSIKNFLIKSFSKNKTFFTSYSQAREDVMLKFLFRKYLYEKHKGFYIDIGAFDPTKGSNTRYLYNCGWSGLNIDANPTSIEKFNLYRKRDINLHIGISERPSEKPFFYFGKNDGINSFSESFIKKNKSVKNVEKIFQVQTETLSSVLDLHLPNKQTIDLMDIDVEGLDFEVVKSNNWKKYRPKILMVELEAKHFKDILSHEISQYLSKQNFEPFYRTIIIGDISTVFFIDLELKENFFY